ncbi:NADPH-dependent 7-cyano-7-deazaguanine reductase QueF, partial [bacterium]|nr:NADPH-dependent 7-cyano-7-deazaguanine reductase QueF [bacterium]
RIAYQPAAKLIETKSLKLFLQGYRDKKAFNEAIVDELADRLFAQAEPAWLTVEGFYNSRGGISVTCKAHRGASG